MNTFSFILIVVSIFLSAGIIFNFLIEYLADKTINVRKHLPKWVKELESRIDLSTINHEKFQFKTSDNILIDTLFIPSKCENKGNILFLHGIRASKYYFIEQAVLLSEKGYNCILPDLRGHGNSEGIYCTFGFLEKTDISLLIDILTSKYRLPNHFGLWGHSMGAAIALQTLELDKRIGFMILEAPFSDLKTILREYFKRKLWYFSVLVFYHTIKRIEKKLGFPINDVNPSQSARNIYQPSILLHGTNDKKILPYHSNLIFNSLSSNNKIKYEIKKADHNNIKEVWEKDYYDVTLRFINNYVNQFQFTN